MASWTSPRTWVDGETPTGDQFNTQIRDNLSYLKDSPSFDGDVTVGDTLTVGNDLVVADDAQISGDLAVTGAVTVAGQAVLGDLPVALTDGATPALNAALGRTFTLSASGNRTIAVPTNPTSGQKIVLAHTASGADRTLALNSGAGGFRFGTDIPSLSATTSGKTDYIGCIYNATASKWDVVAYSKGY